MIIILHCIIGKGGTGKSQRLISSIDELIKKNLQNGQPHLNEKIYVIVPEQFSFEYDKKLYETINRPENFSNDSPYFSSLYGSLGAYEYNHINVTKFSKLSETIINKYGKSSKDYINSLSKTMAMYKAIKQLREDKALSVLEKQVRSIDFIDVALTEVTELRKSNISPQELTRIAENFPSDVPDNVKGKSKDVALIYEKYYEVLAEKNLHDTLSDILECDGLVKANGVFEGATIFIDEFDAFTNDELQLLDTILSQCEDLYISLRMDKRDMEKRKSNQFETVNKTYTQLTELANKNNQPKEDIVCTELYRYSSNDLKTISGEIFSYRKRDKANSIGDVSIVECDDYYQECDYVSSQIRKLIIEGYQYNDIFVTTRHIENYVGIIEQSFKKYDIPYFLSTDKSSIYTAIMVYFITLLEIVSTKKFNTDSILRYLKNPINNISFEQISDLENYCYKWNVKGSMWVEPFVDDDNVTADITRQNIISPLSELKQNIKGKTCTEVCQILFNFMESQSIRENVQMIINNNRANGMEGVADEMVRIWDMLMTILDTLCNFMGNEVIPITDFKDVVCAMISQSDFKVAPQKLDAVNFSSADNARFNSPKILFILGVNDGVFPSSVSTNGIFTNADMQYFNRENVFFSKTLQDKTADEKLVVYKTLSAPANRLYLSYALKNTMGDVKYPSYVVDSVCNLFTDLTVQRACDVPVRDVCSTYKSSYDFYVRNFWNNSQDRTTVESVLNMEEFYANKLQYLKKISTNTELKIQDKNIALKLFKNKIKIYATKFETFNKCHFKYFCSEGLRIRKPVKTDMTYAEIGNIIHYCLENVIKSHDKESFVKLTHSEIVKEVDSLSVTYKEENLGGDYGKNQRFEANFKRVKDSIIQTIRHLQEEFSQLEFTPSDFELSIDDNGDYKPLSITNEDGMELFLCGKIDRVDILTKGDRSYVRVIDYKSGTQEFEEEKLPYGIDMQMFLYLFAITGSDGKYKGYTPAGVLYMPVSEVSIGDVRSDAKKNVPSTVNKHFKMKGVVLNDTNVLKSMEKDLQGVYIPFAEKGRSKKMVLTEQQFDNIKNHAESLLINMANSLSSGDISAKALVFSSEQKERRICAYCDYWSVCGKYPAIDCNYVDKDEAKELYKQIISEEGDQDDKVD